eukprot:g18076.t2
MGGVLSAPNRGNIENEDEDIWKAQHEILTAKLDFFRNWRIEDVDVVLDCFRARIGLGEAPSTIIPAEESSTDVTPTAHQPESRVDYAAVQLEWHELFHAVLDAEAKREQSNRLRRQWHVAARGYAMVKNDDLAAAPQETPCSQESGTDTPSPGHTDDEASDEEGEQTQLASEGGNPNTTTADHFAMRPCTRQDGFNRNLRDQPASQGDSRAFFGHDAAVVSPIFFGYTSTTDADVDAACAKERASLEQEEARIIDKQRVGRNSQLAREREEASKRREARERTVTSLEAEFERARKKRMLELQTAKKVLTAEEYDPVLKQWNADEASITQAHESELAERKCKFAFLNREDSKSIQQAANAAKYAEKVEVSKIPRGAQLEALARGEVERLVGEIDAANEAVKLAQDELLAAQELRGKKGEARARQVVETSLILLEGRATTSEKDLDTLLEQLQEAEFMLKRSQRIRSQEDLVLPLYEPLAKCAAEGDFRAPVFSILCGLAVTSNDTLWEKLTFITQLFDVNDNKFMGKEEICTMLATLASVLDSLKLLRVRTSQEELESLVTRAFLEGNLDYRKGMTNYEVKSWMAGVVARSPRLSDIFGWNWSFGQMSTVMRCKMSMVHEFELGMISMVDLKHKAAIKIQNIFRGKLARQAAESIAKRHAFLCARAMALEDTRQRVAAEIWKKEAGSGVGRLKWDAKVRMKQAKLRAAGENVDRQEVVEAIIEESIQAAQHGVVERFDEIARERGFHENAVEATLEQSPKSDDEGDFLTLATASRQASLRTKAACKQLATHLLSEDIRHAAGQVWAKEAITDLGRPSTPRKEGREDGESFAEMRQREKLADADPPVEELAQRLRSWDDAMTRLKTEGLLAELPSKRLLMRYTQGFVDRADPPGNLEALFDDLARHFQITRNVHQVGTILVNLLQTDFAFGLAADSLNVLRGNQDALLAEMAQIEVANGMSEAEAGYMRRLTAATLQGRSIEEVEKIRNRNTLKEIKKRVQSISEAQAMISKSRSRITTAEQELAEIRRRDSNDRALKRKVDGLPYAAQIQEAHRFDWTRRYTAAMSADEDSEEALEAKYLEITNVCSDFLEMAKHLATTIIDEQNFDLVDKTIRPVIETDCHGRSVEGNRGHAGKRYKYEAFNIRLMVCSDDHGLFNGDDECAAKGYGGREVLGSLEYMKQHQPGLNIPLTCVVDYHGFRVLAVAKVPIITPVFTSSGKLRKAREDMVHGTADEGDTIRNENRVLSSKLQTVAEKLNLSSHMVKGVRELNSTALWAAADLRGYKKDKSTFYLLKFWRAFPSEDPTATPHLKSSARGQSILWRGLRPELVIPRFAEELCQKRTRSVDGSSGYGFSLTADMHRRGIGIRHMGLLRDMFWRPLHGNVDVSFNSKRVRTRTDMRLQLRRGDQVRIGSSIFTVSVKAKHEFSASYITLDRKVEMMSRNNIPVFKGKVSSDKNCLEIRRLLLAEMAARATKNMLRQLLRTSAAQSHTTAHQTQVLLTVESMNIVSGSHERSQHFWNGRLLPSIRSRFGELAVDHAEQGNIRLLLQPCIIYIIQRLQEMLGFTLSTTCSNHFYNRPCGFKFTTLDISNAPIRIKHNVPMKEVADASVLVLRANKARATDYVQLVQMAKPQLYLTLQERKGSRVAVNHGLGGIAVSGYFIGPIKFERPGPIANDPLNRAVQLHPATQCHIDTKNTGKLLAPMQSHLPFSAEVWAKCEGGIDTTRYVLMTGRYSLLATRENVWAASICTEDGSELSVVGPKVVHGEWVYLVVTYDGVIVRMFVNAELVAQIELHAALEHARREKRAEQDKALAAIQEEENQARERCKAATDKELDVYCKTREGETKLSRAAHKLREKAMFASQMDRDATNKGVVKMSKADAKAQARLEIKTEMYMRNVQKVAQKYKRKRDDLQDLAAQEREEICERAEKPLRFEAALAFAPDDIEIISRYAQSVVNFLELESVQSKNPRRSQRMVEEAVEMFVRMENWDGLAVVFTQLPSAPLYAGSFCQAFLATVDAVPDYYSSSLHMPLKILANMPKKFYLDLAGADEMMTEVAASVYRLVLSDLSLADTFGQVDLSWLPVIKSAPTVVAIVLQAESDDDERIVDLEKYHLDCSDVQETDVMALISNRRLAVVLNLTGCKWVTDRSMEHVTKVLVHLQAFTISGCQRVSDKYIERIRDLAASSA